MNNENNCRICLEKDEIGNMIYPCRCSGTSKWVHKECLNQWRTLSDNRDAFYKCFECNHRYKYFKQVIITNHPHFINV